MSPNSGNDAKDNRMDAEETLTYRQRVDQFWKWFPVAASSFGEMLENDKSDQVVAEIQDQMHSLLPNLCWVFGGNSGQYSFTVTGEGQIAKQLLAAYWLSQAVEVPGWSFFNSRQPMPPDDFRDISLGMQGEEQIDVENFLIATTVDDENQKIDVVGWHPSFSDPEDERHLQIFFLLLDEALGEFGTQTWLGDVSVGKISSNDQNVRSLADLAQFVEGVEKYHRWEKLSPLESYSAYEVAEQGEYARGDTLFGTTCIPYIIFDYLENGGQLLDNPLEGTGAELIYVAIEASVFPDGQQVDVRSNIEDSICEALAEQDAGRSLGGAFGIAESYIEFLLMDGENSRRIVESTLKRLKLQDQSRIENFA